VQTTLHVSVVDGVPAAWAAIEPVSSPAADAYGLDAKALGALFTTLPIDGFQAPLATSSANAWLPTRKGVVAPLADAGGSPATGARVVFQRRAVCIASLTWPQTVALLSESRGRETFGNDIRIGRDLAAFRVRELGTAEWRAVGAAIENDLRLSATLLAGDMPEDIEAAFAAAGTSLFPTSIDEMKTACSCPDW